MLSPSTDTASTDEARSWTVPRARIAGYKRRGRPDSDPDLVNARRELKAARIEEHVRRVVDTAPALDQAQRGRLALLLLRGGGPGA